MRYSIWPREQKYIKGYGFLSFAKKLGYKYGKNVMETATRTVKNAGMDVEKEILKES